MSTTSTKTTEQKPATVNNTQPENAKLVQNNNVASESESAFWKNDWIRAQNTLSSIRRSLSSFPSPPLRILRVSQLDADLLDIELFAMLKEQLWQAFSLLDPYYKRYELELMAIIQFILYRFSIYETGASFGAQLQNLKYRNEKMHNGGLQSTANDAPLSKMQRMLFGLFTIGGQYVWAKVNRLVTAFSWGDLAENDPRKIFWTSLQKLEHLYYTSVLVNFLVFLYDGRYRTLVERMLSMRLVYARRVMNRQISFEFLNRQLIWHTFTEFLLFLVPLINLRKLKNKITHTLIPESYIKSHTLAFLPSHICAICHENQSSYAASAGVSISSSSTKVNNPYETNCGHVYCYYCIKSKLILDGGMWRCLRCGEEVNEIRRFDNKVEVEEEEERVDDTSQEKDYQSTDNE